MHSGERKDFDAQMALLCAGFNVPMKTETTESYWTAFRSLHLVAFTRLVEHALGPNCTTKRVPTVGDLWDIYRELRKRAEASTPPLPSGPPGGDRFEIITARLLYLFLQRKGPFDDLILRQLLNAKAKLVDDYRLIATEEEITDVEFGRATYLKFAAITGVTDIKFDAKDLRFGEHERAA